MNRPQNIDDIISGFPNMKRSGDWWIAPCPLQGHKTPDGHITLRNDDKGKKAKIECQGGRHSYRELCDYLGFDSLIYAQNGTGFDTNNQRKLVATYSYEYEQGKEAYQIGRFDLGGGKKSFEAWHKEDNEYVKGMGEFKGKPILYMLPQLREAIKGGKVILIPEGEEKAKRLRELGFEATTNPFGAGKWRESYTKELAGGNIVILPDYDKPGLDFVEQKAQALIGATKRVRILKLPDVERLRSLKGKDGVDILDWLNAGGTKEQLEKLVDEAPAWVPQSKEANATSNNQQETSIPLHTQTYCIENGCFYIVKKDRDLGLKVKSPLSNFTASIKEEICLDSGVDQQTRFLISGVLQDGTHLPEIEIPATEYGPMTWVVEKWGSRPQIMPGTSTKDHLRYLIQSESDKNGIRRRHVFTHTGWLQDAAGNRFFLTASGALGTDGVEVDLRGPLARYSLPKNLNEVDRCEAMKASLGFLKLGKFDVMCSLWAEMYLAPLVEFLNPAFTMWLLGHTGSFKSVLSALALSHFGNFSYLTLPASWRNTANQLEQLLALGKDVPIVIDDYHPQPDTKSARELEVKAEIVIRGQGNKAGRGRLRSDITFREDPIPRGLVISSGEQLPGGESLASRMFVVEVERSDVKLEDLRNAQQKSGHYKYAMSHYILWIKDNWDYLKKNIPEAWELYRDRALEADNHLRLPTVVAWLYTGLEQAISYATDVGAISIGEAAEMLDKGWKMLLAVSARQGTRINEERPMTRFVQGLSTLLDQRRAFVTPRVSAEPTENELKQGSKFIGWFDAEWYYLLPDAAYGAVYEFYSRGGKPFTFNSQSVWADLERTGYTKKRKDQHWGQQVWIGEGESAKQRRVIWLKKSAFSEQQL